MKDTTRVADSALAGLVARNQAHDELLARGHFVIECRDADGKLKWVEDGPNLIVTAGLNKLLQETLSGSAYTAAWFMGLINASGFTAIAAADTMASHAGWTESAAYSAGTRPAVAFAAASGGSMGTSAAVSFAINATATLKGVFLADNSTKSGTTGTLFSAKAFAADRSVQSGDTLNVTYTATLTAS